MFSLLLGICPRVQFPDQMLTLCLTLWRTTKTFSTAAAPLYIPISSAKVFQFLHMLPKFVMLVFCLYLPSGYKVLFNCGFSLHFMCLLAIHISSLEKCLFKSFAYFLIELCALFVIHVFGYSFEHLLHSRPCEALKTKQWTH